MNFIEFSENDLVHVNSIDYQHKKFVEILNKLFYSFNEKDKEKIITYLDELIEHLEIHFENEENLMKMYNYPGYISHKLEHDRIYKKILSTAEKNKSGELDLSVDDLNSLKRWFYNHLDLNDKKCGEYLAEKGIS